MFLYNTIKNNNGSNNDSSSNKLTICTPHILSYIYMCIYIYNIYV